MENAIKFLRIQNFKSIKDVTLRPRRVNLIIGEPNVGKSNLLEAMTLLGGIFYEQTEKFMGSFIRYEDPRQLFYDNLAANTIKVETNEDIAILLFKNKEKLFNYLFCDLELYKSSAGATSHSVTNKPVEFMGLTELIVMQNVDRTLAEKPKIIGGYLPREKFIYTEFDNLAVFKVGNKVGITSFGVGGAGQWLFPPKSYVFNKHTGITKYYENDYYMGGNQFLNPPSGSNLTEIIQTHLELRQEISRMFERYGQKLLLRMDERRLEIVKEQDGIIYSYPYSSVADTLQRIIFYLAAIESNDDAVLLFEEPEAHSFPVYVARLGRRIVESRNNQFFIDTHSPYLITEVLEKMLTDDAQAGELAIFAAYYEDHQTKVHQLSDEEIRSIRADGIDVFYNMKRFTTGTADA